MKPHILASDNLIVNDPELQWSDEVREAEEKLDSYVHKAQEDFKAWLASKNLPTKLGDNLPTNRSQISRISDYHTEINGLTFYYEDKNKFSFKCPHEFVLNINVSAMGSFDPNDTNSRETQYYTTLARFMMDADLRNELKTYIENFIAGKKELQKTYSKLVDEHNNKIRAKVNEINHQIDQENFKTQLEILKNIPADGYIYVLTYTTTENTGFTYRNKPITICENQDPYKNLNSKRVPARLVRVGQI